jgi:hypothetical protein
LTDNQSTPMPPDVRKLVADIISVCSSNKPSSVGQALQFALGSLLAHDMARHGVEGRDKAIDVVSTITVAMPEMVAIMLSNLDTVPNMRDPRDQPRDPVAPSREELTNRVSSICAGADLNTIVDALLNAYVLHVAGGIHMGMIEEKSAADVIARGMQMVPDAIGDRLAKLRRARPSVLQ